MAFKVSWFYKQQAGDRTGGWTENYWWDGNDMSVAEAGARKLFNKLDLLHGRRAWAGIFRLSNPDNFREAENFFTGIAGPNPDSTTYQETDYPVVSLLLETRGAVGKTRQWIRGIPDDIVKEGGKYTPDSNFKRRLGAFVSELTGGGNAWSRRFLDPNNILKPITAIDLATGIVTIPEHGMGNIGLAIEVRIKGFKTPKSVNKVWRAIIQDSNTLQLSFFQPITGEVATGKNPTARKQTYDFEKITGAKIIRVTSHKTGRPIGQLSGRAKNREA